jgi:hypothetical protein
MVNFGTRIKSLNSVSILLLSLPFSFDSTSIAQADQCLSQFPDSAWVDGQPTSITLVPRNLIMTEFKVEAVDSNNPPISEDEQLTPNSQIALVDLLANSWILHDFTISGAKSSATLNLNNTFSAKISLTYQGVGCSPRTVSFQKQVVTTNYSEVKPSQPASEETLMNVLNPQKYQNSSVSDKNNILAAWSYFISLIDATKSNPMQIDSNPVFRFPLSILNLAVAVKDNVRLSNYAGFNFFNIINTNVPNVPSKTSMPLSVSTDRCFTLSLNYPLAPSTLNLGTFYGSITDWLNPHPHFVKPGALCGLSVYFFDGQNSLVNVGTLWIKDSGIPNSKTAITNKNVTIKCVKGRSTTQISGIKPSCPKGYKTTR